MQSPASGRKKKKAPSGTNLSGVEGLQLNTKQESVKPNYAYYPVVFDGFRLTRDEVFDRLKAEGIVPRKYFYPLTSAFACYRGRPGFSTAETPVAERVAANVLTRILRLSNTRIRLKASSSVWQMTAVASDERQAAILDRSRFE